MRLDTLKPAEGSRKAAVRVGRGIGSGLGKMLSCRYGRFCRIQRGVFRILQDEPRALLRGGEISAEGRFGGNRSDSRKRRNKRGRRTYHDRGT